MQYMLNRNRCSMFMFSADDDDDEVEGTRSRISLLCYELSLSSTHL